MPKYVLARNIFFPDFEGGREIEKGAVIELSEQDAAGYLERGSLVPEGEVKAAGETVAETQPEETGEQVQVTVNPTPEQLAQDFQQTGATNSPSGPVNQ